MIIFATVEELIISGGRRADSWSFGVKSVASKLSGEKGAYSEGLVLSLKL